MSDIFVSYDDQDRPRVRPIVEAFEARGWSVWWDHRIATGEAFAAVIERELEAASCVVVVWSNTSVHSEWVRAEADEAWKRRKLVPVLLDRVEPPMPFGQIQAADLVDWTEQGHQGFAKLVADMGERIGTAPVHPETAARAPRFGTSTIAGRSPASAVSIGAAILAIVALIAWFVPWPPSEPASTGVDSATTDRAAATPVADAPLVAPVPAPGRGGESPGGGAVSSAAAGGHWQAHVTYTDGASFEERFTFAVTGRELSGTASMRGYGYRRGILDGTIDGDRLSFRAKGTVQFNLSGARAVTYLYKGTLGRDAIRFTVEEEGTGDPAVAFTAGRISAEQAERIATGGTRPRLSGMDTGKLYRLDYVRDVVSRRQKAIDACYKAAEFDEANHEFVDFHVTLSASGTGERFEMRPGVTSLESCMRDVLSGIEWGPTDSGKGGTLRLSISARLPWNP